tara:strand:- start:65 stop:298 length:234 start_codon:yes stop_codon:yes gene_type:complete
MANSRLEQEWWHTANLMALQINQNRKKGAPPVKPHELNPLVKRRIEKKAHRTVGVEALKAFLPLNDPNRKGFDIGKT